MSLNKVQKALLKVDHAILVGMFEQLCEDYMDALQYSPKQKKRYWKILVQGISSEK